MDTGCLTQLLIDNKFKEFLDKEQTVYEKTDCKDKQEFIPTEGDFKQEFIPTEGDLDYLYGKSTEIGTDNAAQLLKSRIKYLSSPICCFGADNAPTAENNEYKGLSKKVKMHVERLLKDRGGFPSCKENDSDSSKDNIEIPGSSQCTVSEQQQKIQDKNLCPKRQLFIWALLMNRMDFAVEFWTRGKDFIYTALFASALLKALSKKAHSQEDMELCSSFEANARFFEKLACDVVMEIYKKKRDISQILLVKAVSWSSATKQTEMALAARHQLMEFMSTTACQTKLNTIWKLNLDPFTSRKKVIICSVLPFFIPTVRFVDNKPDSKTYKKVGCQTKDTINIFAALDQFYNAPVTKFWTYLMAYFGLLGCFSFFLLTDFHPIAEKHLSGFECFTWIWTISVIVEEIRQILTMKRYSTFEKLRSYWESSWNKFDVIMYALLIFSVVLRFTLPADYFHWARMAYSLTLAIFIIRTFHFFYVDKYTGPKVIMIGKMVTHLQFFVQIFAVVLLSFGVITQINLFPNAEASWQLLKNVVYIPYWQMFGELFLDTIEGHGPSECTDNPLLYRNETMQRCPESNALVPLILAVYMVFTNIMLINLLIAMFSDTFQKVEENSEQIWKFHRYSLVFEYYEKPVLLPPLIIFNHLFRVVRFIIRKFEDNCLTYDDPFTQDFEENKIKEVAEAERDAMKVVRKRNQWHVDYSPTQNERQNNWSNVKDRLDEMATAIGDMQDKQTKLFKQIIEELRKPVEIEEISFQSNA